MAIKALEDALREKDQAMERERDRFNKELDGERKKRNDLEIQVNNPEEGETNGHYQSSKSTSGNH